MNLSLVDEKICCNAVKLSFIKLFIRSEISVKSFNIKSAMKTISVIKMDDPSFARFDQNKKIHEKIMHFSRIFRPIYIFARVCGLMPFSVQRSQTQNQHFEPRVSKFDVLWFAISMCFYIAMVTNTFLGKIILPHESNDQLNAIILGNHLLRLMILIFGVFALIMDMCNRYKLINILNKFTVFDQEAN